MSNAFNYMFKDNKFGQKALRYFIVYFIVCLCTSYAESLIETKDTMLALRGIGFSLIGFILSLIPIGYSVSCVKSLIEQKENYILPYLNIKNNLRLGFKLSIAGSLLGVILGALFIIVGILFGIFAVVCKPLSFAIIIFGIILICIIGYYSMGLTWLFAKTEAWTSFIKFKEVAKLVKNNTKNYLKQIGLGILLTLILISSLFLYGGLIGLLFEESNFRDIVLINLGVSLFVTYSFFVSSFLTAKCIQEGNLEGQVQ